MINQQDKGARVDMINGSLIDALIKMALVDEVLAKEELSEITEIYFLLFDEEASISDLETRIMKLKYEDIVPIGDLAESIANSIRSKSSKESATESLIEVMFADGVVHEKEEKLIKKIGKLWGTTQIVESYLNTDLT